MTKQSGSALVYILVAIALLAALTASFMQPASQQTSSQNIVKTVSDVKSQVEFIRSSIQECVLMHPGGDTGLIGTVNFGYPINPSSAYFDAPDDFDPDDIDTNEVKYIRCPGNPGDSANHAKIFGGNSGKFMPPPPPLFEDWMYYSGVDGVFFYTYTTKTDAFLTSALERLDEEFSECEADIISDSSEVEMTSTAGGDDPKCAADNTCFRVWVITRATAEDAYQSGGDEETAGCP